MRHPLHLALAACTLTLACGDGTYSEVAGTVGGKDFSSGSYYWGEPFIVFIANEVDCMNMSWVRRGPTFQNGGDAPTEEDVLALIITYDEEEVVEGNNSVEGDAPVDARVIEVSDGALTVYKAREGFVDVTEFNKKDDALGSVDVTFDDGSIAGAFQVPWCNNLKSKN